MGENMKKHNTWGVSAIEYGASVYTERVCVCVYAITATTSPNKQTMYAILQL